MNRTGEIYIATVLLEKNRWNDGDDNRPSFAVSGWTKRFAEAGFDGVELWQKHATMVGAEELAALDRSPCPIRIFNSYVSLEDSGLDDRRQVAEMTGRLGAEGVKFNVGRDVDKLQTYVKNLVEWRSAFGSDVTLLCECHPGTIIEEPKAAKAFFDEVGLDGFGVIVHAPLRPDKLTEWFDCFGDKVMHAHVQMAEDRRRVRLDSNAETAREVLDLMRGLGYTGSYTIEFTEGVAAEKEDMDQLLANAAADMEFIRSVIS